jgi:tRNA pseudouridine38-40 synthase
VTTTGRTVPAAPRAAIGTVRLRVDLAYDGAPYRGLARQPGHLTVQGTYEEALARLLELPSGLATVAAGRTDRGVHAAAQVLHVDVPMAALVAFARARRIRAATPDDTAVLDRLATALDRALPPSIVIHGVRRVPHDFSARFTARWRAYRYRLRDDVDPRAVPRDPVTGRTPRGVARDAPDVWGLVHRLDVPAMRSAGRLLLGEHDFAALCRRAEGRTTMRRLDELRIVRLGPGPGRIDVRLRGPAFCHQQVRSIVGCLVDVGRGRRPPEWVGEVLASRDRRLAAAVAPPHGLTLEGVGFGPGRPASPPPGAPRRAPAGGGTHPGRG